MSSALPASYVGVSPGAMHLVVLGSLSGRPCTSDLSDFETVEVRGTVGRLYTCSEFEGLNADHIVLEWREDDVVASVSVHGHNEANRALVQDIATGIQFVEPRHSRDNALLVTPRVDLRGSADVGLGSTVRVGSGAQNAVCC